MALSKPIMDLAKTSGGGGGASGSSQDNKQVFYIAAAAAATVATVGVGYLVYSRLYASSTKDKGTTTKDDEEKTKSGKKDAPPYQALKELGNQKFKSGDYNLALENYTKAIEMLDSDPEVTGEGKAQTLSMLFQNRAAVFEKLVSNIISGLYTIIKLSHICHKKLCIDFCDNYSLISVKLAYGYKRMWKCIDVKS